RHLSPLAFVDGEIAVYGVDRYAVKRPRFLDRNVAVAHIAQNALGIALVRISEASAAGRFQPDDIARATQVGGIAPTDFSRLGGAWVGRAFAGAPRHPAFETLRRDGVFRGAQRHTRFLVERFVLAHEAQAAAKFSRAAGVGNELEASDARGEFRFDDLDRRD